MSFPARHASDCALHNAPAYEPGECDCRGDMLRKVHEPTCSTESGGFACDCVGHYERVEPKPYPDNPLEGVTAEEKAMLHGKACDAYEAADGLVYDYRPAVERIEGFGCVIDPAELPGIDATFSRLGMTQEQANEMVIEHAWRMKWRFTPSNYTAWQRIKIALYFLFSRKAA